MSKVFVLDSHKQPLIPVHPGRARILLSAGKAAVYRRFPFTIILKGAVEEPKVEPCASRLILVPTPQVSPLSKTHRGRCFFAADLRHRGFLSPLPSPGAGRYAGAGDSGIPVIETPLHESPQLPEGWLPPSLQSRIANVMTWVGRWRGVPLPQSVWNW